MRGRRSQPQVQIVSMLVTKADEPFTLMLEPEAMSYDFPEEEKVLLTFRGTGAAKFELSYNPGCVTVWRPGDTEVWAANPEHGPGQRGKRRRPKHVNLLDRLDGHRDEVLRYAADLRVPFTNNGSERDIRPLKIRLKVAGCLRTMAGAQAFCRLRSYLSSARKQGQSAFGVLRMLHAGNPWMPVTA